jgi:hypothetical protein
MKKIYIPFLIASLTATTSVFAQQLPNPGFEGDWVSCIPWTSKGNTSAQGTIPSGGWNISNTIGTGSMGKTTVGASTEGNGSDKAVALTNTSQTGNVIPAYLTLGTPWSASLIKVASVQNGSADGGTFGGIEFAYRPDAIQFDYKRSHGSESTQPAKVIAYSWTGEWNQEEVPGDNAWSLSNPKNTYVTMVDRDRNILGKEVTRGGDISKSGTLVASLDYSIESEAALWKTAVAEFDYKTEDTPEKFNVIFAAFDYFGDRSNIVADDALTIDNVTLLYYSRLSSITVNGEEISKFSSTNYEFTVATPITSVDYTLLGGSNTATVAQTIEDGVATIIVTNAVGEDADGESTHTYIVRYDENYVPDDSETSTIVDTVKYTGTLTVEMLGNTLVKEQAATINITQEEGSDVCTFGLPHFSIDLGSGAENLGDIVIENVEKSTDSQGNVSYYGKKEGLSLANGEIEADVTISGTVDASGVGKFDISVEWMGIPINVTFNSTKVESTGIDSVQGSVDSTVIYYNLQGVRVQNPNKGIYLRKQGNKTTKIYIK